MPIATQPDNITTPANVGKLRKRREPGRPKIALRARGLNSRPAKPALPLVRPVPGLNQVESRIYYALLELKIRFTAQERALGGSLLGGAKYDFVLHDYGIDLEYNGPFHATNEGRLRDLNRNITPNLAGLRVVPLYEKDLRRLKARLIEIIGSPVAYLG